MSEKSINAACQSCDTTFAVCHAPIPMDELGAALLAARCPTCGGKNLNLIASNRAVDVPLPPHPNADTLST